MSVKYSVSKETIHKCHRIMEILNEPLNMRQISTKLGLSKQQTRHSIVRLMKSGHVKINGILRTNKHDVIHYISTGKIYDEVQGEVEEVVHKDELPSYITRVTCNDYQPTRREIRTHSAWARPEGGMYI